MLKIVKNSGNYKNKAMQALRDENERLQSKVDYLAMMTGVDIEENAEHAEGAENGQV